MIGFLVFCFSSCVLASPLHESPVDSLHRNINLQKRSWDGYYDAGSHCDGRFFGHPNKADCRAALKRLPDYAPLTDREDEYVTSREFLGPGATADVFGPDHQVQTPFIVTNGTCSVALVLPQDPPLATTMIVDTQELNSAAQDLYGKCVDGTGSGGYFHHAEEDMVNLPDIIIFGPGSDAEQFLDFKFNCLTDADGNAICQNLDTADKQRQSGNSQTGSSEPSPVPKGSKKTKPAPKHTRPHSKGSKCSGSCLDPDECDISSDCVCASNAGIPLSSTWGQHTCMYIAGAAITFASAAIKPAGPCHGRCLLDEDGTLEVPAPANTSDTDPPRPGVSPNLSNDTDTLPFGTSPTTLPSGFPTPNITFPDATSPVLNCPCNCTYVSAACCLSRTVWEAPSMQIQMASLPANASECCDATSGKWMPKSDDGGCTAPASNNSADSDVGFIGMGSVPISARPSPSATVEGNGG